jgi:hypothetical protein
VKKLQVLVELDLETKQVTTTGPMSHPGVVVKMLAAALQQVGDAIEAERMEQAKAKKAGPDIVIPKLHIGRA